MSDDIEQSRTLEQHISGANRLTWDLDPAPSRDEALALGTAAFNAAADRDYATSTRLLERADEILFAEYKKVPYADAARLAAELRDSPSQVDSATALAQQAAALANSITPIDGASAKALREARAAEADADAGQHAGATRAPLIAAARAELADAGRDAAQARATAAVPSPSTAVPGFPAGFDETYVKQGKSVLRRDGNAGLMMIDQGHRLDVPKAFDAEQVKLVVDTAQSRGWDKLVVKGTDEFRKAVWAAASTRGLDVVGYAPSAAEEAWAQKQREDAKVVNGFRGAGPGAVDLPNSVGELEIVAAFKNAKTGDERAAAAAQHPKLVQAFALDEYFDRVSKGFSAEQHQAKFIANMRSDIADLLAQGAEIPQRVELFKSAEPVVVRTVDQPRARAQSR